MTLVERLRDDMGRLRMHMDNKTKAAMQHDCEKAADRIEQLEAENAELRLIIATDTGTESAVAALQEENAALREDAER